MHARKIDSLLYSVTAVFLTVLFLYMPDTVTESVKASLYVCALRVIPSVFPFSVLSSFFVKSGGADSIDKALSRPFYHIFGITHGASAFLCGLFFGFPLGAMTAGSLYKNGQLSEKECSRLLAFGCCASPTFPVFAVGKGLFGSTGVGVFLWVLQLAASFLVGLILRLFSKKEPFKLTSETEKKRINQSFPELLSASVKDASLIILTVCGSVTFFSLLGSVVAEIIYGISGNVYLRVFFTSFFEFATGSAAAAEAYTMGEISRGAALGFAGFAIGFSGLSVICQNASVIDRSINLIPHFCGKLLCGTLTGIIAYFMSDLIFESVSVSVTANLTGIAPLSILPSLSIILFSILLRLQKKK